MRNAWRIAIIVGLGLTAFAALYVLPGRAHAQAPSTSGQSSAEVSLEQVADTDDAFDDEVLEDKAWAEIGAWQESLDAQEAESAEAESDASDDEVTASAPSSALGLLDPPNLAAPLAVAATGAVPPRLRGFNTAQLVDWLHYVDPNCQVNCDVAENPEPIDCPAPTATNHARTTKMTRFACGLKTMAASGSKLHRLAVFWADVQPDNNSQWKWEKYKYLVDHATAAGLTSVILTPVGSPDWARRPARRNQGTFGKFAHPDVNKQFNYLPDWSNFITRLATEFKPVGFEIWNEENTNNFWDATATNQPPSPSLYTKIYCAASQAIQAAGSTARIGVGGLAPIVKTDFSAPNGGDKVYKSSAFIEAAFKKGLGDGSCRVDFVGYHPYLTKSYCTRNPAIGKTAYIHELDLVHQKQTAPNVHAGRKVWITEWGFPSRNFDGCTRYSGPEQARLIRLEHEYLARLPYTAFSGYFNMVDDDQPNVNGSIGVLCSNWSAKPSYNTWRRLRPAATGPAPAIKCDAGTL